MDKKELPFNFEKRKRLESYVKKNLSKSSIAISLNVTRPALYKELAIGELIKGDWKTYSAIKAQAYIKEQAWEEYQWKVQ